MGQSKQVGKVPAAYAHLLTMDWAAGYKSLTLIKERKYTFFDKDPHVFEIPAPPTEHAEKIRANFPTHKFFRAEILYAKVNVILSEVDEVPRAFVHAFGADKCVVPAGNAECWILTVREVKDDPT